MFWSETLTIGSMGPRSRLCGNGFWKNRPPAEKSDHQWHRVRGINQRKQQGGCPAPESLFAQVGMCWSEIIGNYVCCLLSSVEIIGPGGDVVVQILGDSVEQPHIRILGFAILEISPSGRENRSSVTSRSRPKLTRTAR